MKKREIVIVFCKCLAIYALLLLIQFVPSIVFLTIDVFTDQVYAPSDQVLVYLTTFIPTLFFILASTGTV